VEPDERGRDERDAVTGGPTVRVRVRLAGTDAWLTRTIRRRDKERDWAERKQGREQKGATHERARGSRHRVGGDGE